MATVQLIENSDYEDLAKLGEEIKKLEDQLNKFDASKVRSEIKQVESQLRSLNERLKEMAEKEAKNQFYIQERIRKEVLDLAYKTEQARINLMKDGSEKRLAQIDYDYDKELSKLEEKVAKWKEAQGGTLTLEQTQVYDNSYQEIFNKRTNAESASDKAGSAEEKAARDKELAARELYLKEYGEYHEKIAAIKAEYSRKIEAEGNPDAQKTLREQMKKELAAVEKDMLQSSTVWKVLMGDLTGVGSKMVQEYIDQAEIMLGNSTNLTEKETEEMKKTIDAARKTISERNPFEAMSTSFKKYRDALKSGDPEEAQKHFADFAAASDKVNEIVKTTTTSLSGLGGLFSGDLSAVMTEMGSMVTSIGAAVKGFSSGGNKMSAISGVVSAITVGLDDFIGALNESGRATKELEEYQMRFNNQYFLLLNSIKAEDYETIFGIDAISKSIAAYDKLINVRDQYEKSLNDVSHAATRNTTTSDIWGKELHKQNQINLKALEKGYTETQAMPILLQEANKWQKLIGKGSRYTTLKDLAPQLWDENNEFQVDAAKVFLETNKEINKENNASQKSVIENLIALDGKKKELQEIIESDLKDTFGYLGTSLLDHVTNAIKGGSNAWEDFRKIGSQAIESLGKELMYNLFFAKAFDELQENLEKTYEENEDPEKLAGAQAQVLDDFFDNLGGTMEAAQKWGEEWQKQMKEKGFDTWAADENKATQTPAPPPDNTLKGAYAKASQESIDLLAGQTGAARVALEDIRRMMLEEASPEKNDYYMSFQHGLNSIIEIQRSGWSEVAMIRELSLRVANHTETLTQLSQHIANSNSDIAVGVNSTAKDLNIIVNNGVKLKSMGLAT